MSFRDQTHRYQEIEIKTAAPVELVVLLYDGAIATLQKAQEHLAARNIEKRTRCLNKASSILTELQASLNFEKGSDLSPSLDRLYRYMKDRLFQANLQQDAAPLQEVVKLLGDLRGAWAEVSRKAAQPNPQPDTKFQAAPPAMVLPMTASAERLSTPEGINITA